MKITLSKSQWNKLAVELPENYQEIREKRFYDLALNTPPQKIGDSKKQNQFQNLVNIISTFAKDVQISPVNSENSMQKITFKTESLNKQALSQLSKFQGNLGILDKDTFVFII